MTTKSEKSQKAKAAHRKVQTSTTHNRKSVKRPTEAKKVEKTKKTEQAESIIKIEKKKPVVKVEISTDEQKLEKAIKTVKKEKKKKVVSKITVVDLAEAKEEPAKAEEQKQAEPAKTTEPEQIIEPVKIEEQMKAEEPKQAEAKPQASVIIPQADMSKVHDRMRTRANMMKKMPEQAKTSAKELKNQAIEKALAAAAKASSAQPQPRARMRMDWRRVVLALVCATAAVFAIVYFVNLNAPDISLKVAAMQTGIEASYPGYVPRDFSLSDITSEDGKVTLNFKNATTGDAFAVIEEKSSWDSNALLANYVKREFGDTYSAIKEQGLTIYVSGSDAAWVNGGVVYKIDTIVGSLTKKQITNIATSL